MKCTKGGVLTILGLLALSGLTVALYASAADTSVDIKDDIKNAVQHIGTVKFINKSDSSNATLFQRGAGQVGVDTNNFLIIKSGDSVTQIRGEKSSVLGGEKNKVNASNAVILAGSGNSLLGAHKSTIIGGINNKSSAENSTIVGGSNNVINLNSTSSAIVGGDSNVINGKNSIILGKNNKIKGDYSVALGENSKLYSANRNVNNSFLWTDGSYSDKELSDSEVFAVVSEGGMVVNTDTRNPLAKLTISGSLVVGENITKNSNIACGGGINGKGILKLVSKGDGTSQSCLCSCDGYSWNSLYGDGICAGVCNDEMSPKCGTSLSKIYLTESEFVYSGSCEEGAVIPKSYFVEGETIYWYCQTSDGAVSDKCSLNSNNVEVVETVCYPSTSSCGRGYKTGGEAWRPSYTCELNANKESCNCPEGRVWDGNACVSVNRGSVCNNGVVDPSKDGCNIGAWSKGKAISNGSLWNCVGKDKNGRNENYNSSICYSCNNGSVWDESTQTCKDQSSICKPSTSSCNGGYTLSGGAERGYNYYCKKSGSSDVTCTCPINTIWNGTKCTPISSICNNTATNPSTQGCAIGNYANLSEENGYVWKCKDANGGVLNGELCHNCDSDATWNGERCVKNGDICQKDTGTCGQGYELSGGVVWGYDYYCNKEGTEGLTCTCDLGKIWNGSECVSIDNPCNTGAADVSSNGCSVGIYSGSQVSNGYKWNCLNIDGMQLNTGGVCVKCDEGSLWDENSQICIKQVEVNYSCNYSSSHEATSIDGRDGWIMNHSISYSLDKSVPYNLNVVLSYENDQGDGGTLGNTGINIPANSKTSAVVKLQSWDDGCMYLNNNGGYGGYQLLSNFQGTIANFTSGDTTYRFISSGDCRVDTFPYDEYCSQCFSNVTLHITNSNSMYGMAINLISFDGNTTSFQCDKTMLLKGESTDCVINMVEGGERDLLILGYWVLGQQGQGNAGNEELYSATVNVECPDETDINVNISGGRGYENPVCGSANGTSTSSTPSGTAACEVGTLSGMQTNAGSGYSWRCINGTELVYCRACWANHILNSDNSCTPIYEDPVCGSANGTSTSTTPSGTAACAVGTLSGSVIQDWGAYMQRWTCKNGTSSVSCYACFGSTSVNGDGTCGSCSGSLPSHAIQNNSNGNSSWHYSTNTSEGCSFRCEDDYDWVYNDVTEEYECKDVDHYEWRFSKSSWGSSRIENVTKKYESTDRSASGCFPGWPSSPNSKGTVRARVDAVYLATSYYESRSYMNYGGVTSEGLDGTTYWNNCNNRNFDEVNTATRDTLNSRFKYTTTEDGDYGVNLNIDLTQFETGFYAINQTVSQLGTMPGIVYYTKLGNEVLGIEYGSEPTMQKYNANNYKDTSYIKLYVGTFPMYIHAGWPVEDPNPYHTNDRHAHGGANIIETIYAIPTSIYYARCSGDAKHGSTKTQNSCQYVCNDGSWKKTNPNCSGSSGQGNSSGGGCFIAGTQVTMANGSKKNIEDVQVGDLLLGETSINEVEELYRPLLGEQKLFSINGGKNFVTAEHPFKTTRGWRSMDPVSSMKLMDGQVDLLKVGDILITENGYEKITSLVGVSAPEDTQLYNFRVGGDDTYYADGYLVHNKGGCFLAGTQVYMADGTTKNIEDVESGDMVMTYNTASGKIEYHRVLRPLVHENNNDELYELTINGDVLKVTEVHNFYITRDGGDKEENQCVNPYEWIEARYLQVGDKILMNDGTLAEIEDITHHSNYGTVYNLSIEDVHTYFVDKGYLVHNALSKQQTDIDDGKGINTRDDMASAESKMY